MAKTRFSRLLVLILTAILLVAVFAFGLVACNNNNNENNTPPQNIAFTDKEAFNLSADGKILKGLTPEYKNAVSVSLPYNVEHIVAGAFDDCPNLASISLPSNLKSIGEGAFNNTAWYNNQPDGLLYIEKWLIGYKGDMPENSSIVINEETRGIADSAFYNQENLTEITIPDDICYIGESVFSACDNLTSASAPSHSLAYLPKSSIKNVTVTSGSELSDLAFHYYPALETVSLPDGMFS
ncbi:MAG: leucine-rich repeat domain-containing protein, partial [Clostridia bacterium]|nr:leucine-rich repeat domain-containing protein [Clostridia bacterium]